MNYHDRKNRGQQRVIYNEGVTKCIGIHNPDGKVKITCDETDTYDLLNLNSNARTKVLQE